MPKKRSYKEMEKLAAMLPPKRELMRLGVSGREVLDKDPEAKDSKGEPIDAKKWYVGSAFKMVNHYQKIKDAFKKYGQKGVEEYIRANAPKEPAPQP